MFITGIGKITATSYRQLVISPKKKKKIKLSVSSDSLYRFIKSKIEIGDRVFFVANDYRLTLIQFIDKPSSMDMVFRSGTTEQEDWEAEREGDMSEIYW